MGKKYSLPEVTVRQVADTLDIIGSDYSTLWKVFHKINEDDSGFISIGEFYAALEVEQSVFADKLFASVDLDKDEKLSFNDFVWLVCTFCMFGYNEMIIFCFFVYDTRKTGFILLEQIKPLLFIFLEIQPGITLLNAAKQFDLNGDGKLSFDEFKAMHEKFPQLLYPAFQIQDILIALTLGAEWFNNRKSKIERKMNPSREAIIQYVAMLKSKEELKVKCLKMEMGIIAYKCMPWNRKDALLQLVRHDEMGKFRVPFEQGLGERILRQFFELNDTQIVPGIFEEVKVERKVNEEQMENNETEEDNAENIDIVLNVKRGGYHKRDSKESRMRRALLRKMNRIETYDRDSMMMQ